MERFGDALDAFLRFELLRTSGWIAYAVFAVASGGIGLAVVLLDACSVALGRPSHLRLTHGWRATPRNIVLWLSHRCWARVWEC